MDVIVNAYCCVSMQAPTCHRAVCMLLLVESHVNTVSVNVDGIHYKKKLTSLVIHVEKWFALLVCLCNCVIVQILCAARCCWCLF